MLIASRWPRGGVRLSSLDLQYYFSSTHIRPKLLSFTDWAYAGSIALTVAVALGWLGKLILREIATRAYRRPAPLPVNTGRRLMLGMIALLAIGGSIAISWPYRIARLWVRNIIAANRKSSWDPWPAPPVTLTPEEMAAVLRSATIQLPSKTERANALKFLIEQHSEELGCKAAACSSALIRPRA